MATLCRLRALSGLQNFARIQHFRSIASRSASFPVLKKQNNITPISHVQILNLQQRFTEISTPVRNFASLPDMTLEDIRDRCILVLRMFDKVDPDKVTVEARFKEDLGLDSLDAVEIIMAMEDEFGIEIPDETAEKLLNLKDVVECLADSLDVAH